MQVGLLDIGGKIPNLALMKISAYHKQLGDTVRINAGGEVTYVSCIFSKHSHIAERAQEMYKNVVVGGPGWDTETILPAEIEKLKPDYSLYGINYGLGRLTAGCPSDCEYCVVPRTEGRIVRTVNSIRDLANPLGDMVVLLDANILAGSDWTDHFRDIEQWGGWVDFTQGLDIRNVTDLAAAKIAKLKTCSYKAWLKAKQDGTRLRKGQIHFAWDKMENETQVREGIKLLSKYMSLDRLTFYMLCGYNTTFEQDMYRFEVLRSLKVKPFVMLYEGASQELRHFACWVDRYYYTACSWDEFKRRDKGQQSLFEGVI